MGILNLTPDSFYAPSRLLKEDGNPDAEAVVARAQAMVADGATVLDLGACSTRPGFTDVGAEEEWRRLGPVLRPLRDALPDVILSIDTYQPEVVRRVFDAIGPFWVNDVSARPDMICAAASLGLPYIAMHGFTEPALFRGVRRRSGAEGTGRVDGRPGVRLRKNAGAELRGLPGPGTAPVVRPENPGRNIP